MKKIYKPIKNEAYPWITLLIVIFGIAIILFTQTVASLIYTMLGILFIVADIILFVNTYGIIFAHISVSAEKIEYLYKKTQTKIRWKEILSIRNAYPGKRVFAQRNELYQIKVIAVTSENSPDIFFHYVIGNKIESVENISTPYTTDPELPKGMWLSSKDVEMLLIYMRSKVSKSKIKIGR